MFLNLETCLLEIRIQGFNPCNFSILFAVKAAVSTQQHHQCNNLSHYHEYIVSCNYLNSISTMTQVEHQTEHKPVNNYAYVIYRLFKYTECPNS